MQDDEYPAYLKKQSYDDLLSISYSIDKEVAAKRYNMVLAEIAERDKIQFAKQPKVDPIKTASISHTEASGERGQIPKIDSVPMKKFIAIFAASYIGLTFGAGYAAYYLAPQNRPKSINQATILISVILVGFLFARQHKRVLTSLEYGKIVISCIVIDTALQVLVGLPLLLNGTVTPSSFLLVFLSVFIFHTMLFAAGLSSLVIQRYVPNVA